MSIIIIIYYLFKKKNVYNVQVPPCHRFKLETKQNQQPSPLPSCQFIGDFLIQVNASNTRAAYLKSCAADQLAGAEGTLSLSD
ncbi:hypothetical protein L6164_012870 [Bauhinia variegata]|uniref:Uncharacterized protein n=1 Tax=Bauhinia variegata TaxID=167791 RepID=A0ACB9PCW9_BAUVA|nr:hypothetical protein L6164_012870 [Bauhinia variegata]